MYLCRHALIILVNLSLCYSIRNSLQVETFQDDIENVTIFIETYMYPKATVVFNKVLGYEWILQTNFPKILINHKLTKPVILQKNTTFILVMKNITSLNSTLALLKRNSKWESRQPYLVIYKDLCSKGHIEQSFLTLFNHNIYKGVIYDGNGTFYTWYPYDKYSECGTKVNLENVTKGNPYRGKIPKKVHGCRMTVGWNKFSILINDPFDKLNPGALILFLNTLAARMNISLTYLKDNRDFYYEYLVNNSYSRLVEDIERKHIDLVVYCTFHGFDLEPLEKSKNLHVALTYFILPPRRQSILKNYGYNLFPPNVTVAIAATLAVCTVIWKQLSKHSLINSTFNITQLLMQMCLKRIPKGMKIRGFFLTLVLFLMCLNTAYYTKLSSVLTKPNFDPKIKSVRELLLDSKLQVFAHPAVMNNLKGDAVLAEAFRRKMVTLKGNSMAIIGVFLQQNEAAAVVADFHLNWFKNPENLEVMYEQSLDVLIYFLAVKKGLPLLDAINFWVITMREAGFNKNYLRNSTMSIKKYTADNALQLTQIRLGLIHIEGPVTVLLVGSLISIITFLYEILWFKTHHWPFLN